MIVLARVLPRSRVGEDREGERRREGEGSAQSRHDGPARSTRVQGREQRGGRIGGLPGCESTPESIELVFQLVGRA